MQDDTDLTHCLMCEWAHIHSFKGEEAGKQFYYKHRGESKTFKKIVELMYQKRNITF